MKTKFTILFLMISAITKAQTIDFVDINNIKASIGTKGILFKDPATGNAGFEAPINSGQHTFKKAKLWFGGKDANDTLYVAGGEDDSTGYDFQPGPIMDPVHYASQNALWNRVWKVNKSDIDYHIANYQTSGYVPHPSISDWPAHGNVSLGQAQYLAPFYDANADGTYDPMNGDAPMVPGDQCIYFIFNSDTVHAATGGRQMRFEVHGMAYEFNCVTDSALMNTVFLNYKIINRDTITLYNAAVGFYSDVSVVNNDFNFVGCDVPNGTLYGYHTNISTPATMQGIHFIGGPQADSDVMDNPFTSNVNDALDSLGIPYALLGLGYEDGIVDNERHGLTSAMVYSQDHLAPGPAVNQPKSDGDYYNYMHHQWKDGSPLYHGGLGYNTSSEQIEAKYMFQGAESGIPTDSLFWSTSGVVTTDQSWTEMSAGNAPSDKTISGTSGSFTWMPGTTHELDLALVFARDYTGNYGFAALEEMRSYVQSVNSYFRNNLTPCGGTFRSSLESLGVANHMEEISFDVYPNPAEDVLNVQLKNPGDKITYSIYDASGRIILHGELNKAVTSISTNQLSSGIYVLRINGDRVTGAKKFIIR